MGTVPPCQKPDAVVQVQAQVSISDDTESSVERQTLATPVSVAVVRSKGDPKPARLVNDTTCTPPPPGQSGGCVLRGECLLGTGSESQPPQTGG